MKRGNEPRGVIPPIITPFDASGAIDRAIFRREVRHLIGCGVHGLSPGGSTGEGASLTDNDLSTLISIVREENKAGLPIVAGVIRSSTQAAVATALAAKAAGADALMVTPVFYNVLVPDDDGNASFFREIAEASGLPLIVYNVVPQNEIGTELFSQLLAIPGIVGIKQSVGGIMALYEQKLVNGERGVIYSATDEMIASTFSLGADGAISAILSLFPKRCVRMWDLVLAGRHDEARRIQDEIHPLWRAVRGPQFPARMKAALRIMGRDCGYSRSPMSGVSEAQLATMRVLLAQVGDE
ncbi:MAG: dihydrodipicolinate synthase family protein [Rectinemataceae bacterium]